MQTEREISTLRGHNSRVEAVAMLEAGEANALDGQKAISGSSDNTIVAGERLDTDEYEVKVILDKWREFLHLESIATEIH